jgi:putative FmdB family regulatory protein
MPIYEYECNACGHRMEAMQKIADAPLVDCPACNTPQLRKLVSASAFRLGGSGWYETDFKKDNKRNLKEGDKAASCTADSGSKSEACSACPAAASSGG